MPSIRIEYVPISRFFLGWFGFGHLQVTYDPSRFPGDIPQDNWYVMEGVLGVPAGAAYPKLSVQGASGTLTLARANGTLSGPIFGADLVAAIGTPEKRGSRVLPIVGIESLSWSEMAQYGAAINEGGFEYYAFNYDYTIYPTQNSSSAVASLLWQVGIDANNYAPWGLTATLGLSTYLGTGGDDRLTLPTINFNTLSGGNGNDVLTGTDDPGVFRVEKFFGGRGNDSFIWSSGRNIYHGGDPRYSYEEDGKNTISYAGAGAILIELNEFRIPGRTHDLVVLAEGRGGRSGAVDWLASVFDFVFSQQSDQIFTGPGVTITYQKIRFDLGEDDGGYGDQFNFGDLQAPITIKPVNPFELRLEIGNTGTSDAWWIANTEDIVGTGFDDVIYLPSETLRVDGGAGADLIDARNTTQGGRVGSRGYDIEIVGGDGNDIIIAGGDRTYAEGGAGDDDFVLSAMSTDGAITEVILAGGDAGDELFVSYGFFSGTLASFASSSLFKLSGGLDFEGETDDDFLGAFYHQTQQQQVNNTDLTAGVLTFAGSIVYLREGSDLVIELFPGARIPTFFTELGPNGEDIEGYIAELTNPVYIRILDYKDGDYGLKFPVVSFQESEIQGTLGTLSRSDGWNDAVNTITNGGQLFTGFGEQPTADPRPEEEDNAEKELIIGNVTPETITGDTDAATIVLADAGDDTVTTGQGDDDVDGGDGDDVITTNGGADTLDGGAGNDVLRGGAGNDTYIVGQAGDVVIEVAGQGIDTVRSSIDFTLAANVENLKLIGTAISGTGNTLDNTIEGNASDNVLSGRQGNDALYGGGGNDILDGGAGNDNYLYFTDEGSIRIRDTGAATDVDKLALTAELDASGMRAYRLAEAPDDLILDFPTGGRVTIEGFMRGDGIEIISFQNGTTLSR
ncbi:MAG: hypothetical protein K2Y05_07660, partial [Hyphomicrobiaceae bacterium]|nr:hypothetical protein [Hyphomicrobiaceae bacterium]